MNILKKLTEFINKEKLIIYFGIGSIIYIFSTYIIFLNNFRNQDFFYQNLNFISLVFKNLEKNFQEKNLEITLKDGTYTSNLSDPIELINYDKTISIKKNLLYVSKEASDKDLQDKDTLMILNNKELKIDILGEPIIYNIDTLQGIRTVYNYQFFKETNENFYPGSEYFNSLGLNLIILFKSFELFIYLLVVNFIIPIIAYLILYLSGYQKIDYKNFKSNSFIVFSIFLALKIPLTEFVYNLPIFSSILILPVIVSILEKTRLEKNWIIKPFILK